MKCTDFRPSPRKCLAKRRWMLRMLKQKNVELQLSDVSMHCTGTYLYRKWKKEIAESIVSAVVHRKWKHGSRKTINLRQDAPLCLMHLRFSSKRGSLGMRKAAHYTLTVVRTFQVIDEHYCHNATLVIDCESWN